MEQKLKNTPLPDIRGFSLVEGIITGAIVVILGTVLMAVFQMNSRQTAGGGLHTKIQMQYETIVTQIGDLARTANAVLAYDNSKGQDETWPPSATAAAISTNKITMFDVHGNKTGGFQVSGTSLQEFNKTSNAWIPVMVGSNAVTVTDNSSFSLTSDRKWLTCNISVFSVAPVFLFPDTAASRQEVFKCRN